MDVFEDELKQLHAKGFVHRDLRCPSNLEGERFDNIFLTDKGIRLIDTGIDIKHQVGDQIFKKYVELEMQELVHFREFFLNR